MSIDSFLQTKSPVQICAELPVDWKDEVEGLLFFNPRQAALENEILAAIHAYGVPRVLVNNKRLRIEVGNGLVLGTLFALVSSGEGTELVGVLLFLRNGAGMLCLHLSVKDSYAFRGHHAELCVAARLLDGVRMIGARIAGVDHIDVFYKRMGWQVIPLKTKLI